MPRHLFLLKELVKRDFKGRYAGSVLGFVWSFVQPLWLLLLFSFVFATVMKIRLTGETTDNFGLFLFAGLLPWMAIQEGVMRGSSAITDNAELVKKLTFPSQVLVLAVVLAAVLHELIGLAVYIVVLAVMGQLSVATLPLLLVALPLQLALTLGLGLMLSATNVFFRDVVQVLGMVMNGWFYFTPIVYPLDLVPDRFVPWIELNPHPVGRAVPPLATRRRAGPAGGQPGARRGERRRAGRWLGGVPAFESDLRRRDLIRPPAETLPWQALCCVGGRGERPSGAAAEEDVLALRPTHHGIRGGNPYDHDPQP